MTETQTPMKAIERLIAIADPITGDGRKIVADARTALEDVEALRKALGEILPRLQYNHEALLMDTSLEHKIGSDPDCLGCRAYNSGQVILDKFLKGKPL